MLQYDLARSQFLSLSALQPHEHAKILPGEQMVIMSKLDMIRIQNPWLNEAKYKKKCINRETVGKILG